MFICLYLSVCLSVNQSVYRFVCLCTLLLVCPTDWPTLCLVGFDIHVRVVLETWKIFHFGHWHGSEEIRSLHEKIKIEKMKKRATFLKIQIFSFCSRNIIFSTEKIFFKEFQSASFFEEIMSFWPQKEYSNYFSKPSDTTRFCPTYSKQPRKFSVLICLKIFNFNWFYLEIWIATCHGNRFNHILSICVRTD